MKFIVFMFCFFYSSANFALSNQPEIRLCYEDVAVYPWITGDMKGLVIQELQHVEKLTKLNFKYIRLPWKRCQIDAQNGKLDGLIAASFTKERTNWGISPTKSNGELDRNLIGVQLGYSVGPDLKDQGYTIHSSFSTPNDLLEALNASVITVAILQNYATAKALEDNPKFKSNIVDLKRPFKVADQYLLFTKKFYADHPEIVSKVWKAIPVARESAEYKKKSARL